MKAEHARSSIRKYLTQRGGTSRCALRGCDGRIIRNLDPRADPDNCNSRRQDIAFESAHGHSNEQWKMTESDGSPNFRL